MVVQRVEQSIRVKRERTKLAIRLAMESRWEEAASTNRLILQSDGSDVDALNRLGKALSELGRYGEAREAFSKALAISPNNPIARKNAERIGLLGKDSPKRLQRSRVAPQFFIEETARTGITHLLDTASEDILAKMSAGEPVHLETVGHGLVVKNTEGELLGTVPPKLGLRLARMMGCGNRYEAALASVDSDEVRVFIRETYQHMSQRGRPSFPAKSADQFRDYVWEGAYRFGKDEDDDGASPLPDDWEDTQDDEVPRERRSRRAVAAAAAAADL